MHVGQTPKRGAAALSDLYYTLLLKDTGCSSNAARLGQLCGGDELATNREFRLIIAAPLRSSRPSP